MPRRRRRVAEVPVAPEPGRDLLTKQETAWVLRVSTRTVSKYVSDGRLPSVKYGRRVLVPRSAVEADRDAQTAAS